MTLQILAYITTAATLLYGVATFLLWRENQQDRKQRQKQFEAEQANGKKAELYRAFYEARGYWDGHRMRSGDLGVDASQSGKIFEALIRLECQLRLNEFLKQANDLGFAVRTLRGVDEQLGAVGIALGLLTPQYQMPDSVPLKPTVGGKQIV